MNHIYFPQNSCLCLAGDRPASVVYCYGDLVPRTVEQGGGGGGGIYAGGGDSQDTDLLAAQLAVCSCGILAM